MNVVRLTSRTLRRTAKSETRTRRPDNKTSQSEAELKESLDHDDDSQSVLKIVQRFEKDPRAWPAEEQPFAIIEQNFIGRVMHMVELRPERGFANITPIGMMMVRRFLRRLQAKSGFSAYSHTDVFNEEAIRQGTKKAFELISQNAYHDTLSELVERGVCSDITVNRFEGVSHKMSEKQRGLFNLTEEDIYAIAPGVLGPYQFIRPAKFKGEMFLSYGLLCCAMYKKNMLFDAVRHLPLLAPGKVEPSDKLPIPKDYGYAAPRTIFGYIIFGNKALPKRQVDSDVKLLDFQFLIL